MPKKGGRNAQRAGTIRQRKGGTWAARYTVGRDPGTGRQIQKSIYGKTQKEVLKNLQQAQTDLEDGTYVEPVRMTVAQWMDIWIAEYHKQKESLINITFIRDSFGGERGIRTLERV